MITFLDNIPLPKGIKHTAFVRYFGLTKVPLIWFIRPTVLELGDEVTKIKVPFLRRNKNHLGSLYFGVLCAAADIAGGLAAMKHIMESGKNISLAFASFKADFHKRAVGDVVFVNTDGNKIKDLVDKAISSGEREQLRVGVKAYTEQMGEDPVASFELLLSLKLK